MFAYILRRLALIPPTLFGIMVINFAVVQVLPGGPVEQIIAQITGEDVAATARVSGDGGSEVMSAKRPQTGGDSTINSKSKTKFISLRTHRGRTAT